MTHHHPKHPHRPASVGPDASDRSYTWMLMALLGAIGLWLIIYSLGAPQPAPKPEPAPIVIVQPEPTIEVPVQNVKPEPEPSLPEPVVVQPELVNPVEVKPVEVKPTHHRAQALPDQAPCYGDPMDTGSTPSHSHGHSHGHGHAHPAPRSDSEYGGDSAGNPMDQGRVPSQAELDADRAANPDTSKQVDGAERDAGGA